MLELLDSLTNENLILICFVLGILALCLAIGISIEMYTTNKKYEKIEKAREKENEAIENTQSKINIKESADIKYVDENSELEKTKAKMELEKLREKLRLEEEEKQRVIEEKIALEKEKEKLVLENNQEELEKTIVNLKPVINEQTNIQVNNQEELEKTKEINLSSIEEVVPSDEEDAIISYEELKNAKNFGYTDEEMYNNVDEEDAIISVQELERLYNESQSIDVSYNVKEQIENVDNSNIKTSPYDSSIYNMSKTDQDLILEQTANLEKLNEEIRKTNEFLKMLKDLKKNLD